MYATQDRESGACSRIDIRRNEPSSTIVHATDADPAPGDGQNEYSTATLNHRPVCGYGNRVEPPCCQWVSAMLNTVPWRVSRSISRSSARTLASTSTTA